MGEGSVYERSLTRRIEELERERDALRKDIEQVCLQQIGPGILGVATRMHIQRTAGLEQEIDSLNKKLIACSRDNQNLQEELSEAYRIKSQLADLYDAESSKNKDLEKQVKFFQGCIASAFAERDHALMESEKANDRKEAISLQLSGLQNRVDELEATYAELWKDNSSLGIEMLTIKDRILPLEKVVSKFYEIRQATFGFPQHENWEDKCSCLLDDTAEMWTFDEDKESSTSKYIASLEDELNMTRNSINTLHSKIQMGLDIEQHLKKMVQSLEKKLVASDCKIRTCVSALRDFHKQNRIEVLNLLEEEGAQLKSVLHEVHDKIRQCNSNMEGQCNSGTELNIGDIHIDKICDSDCRDSHIPCNSDSSTETKMKPLDTSSSITDDTSVYSEALAIALKEKVAALLLLSQQEERHLLERNLNVALQKKMEELQKSLKQVAHDKVRALMELATVKRNFQLQQENCSCGAKHVDHLADGGTKNTTLQSRDGKFKDFFKKTYMRRWMAKGFAEDDTVFHTNLEENLSIDLSRLKDENVSLRESISNVDRLTSSIHKLRLSLLKVRKAAASTSPIETITATLDKIIFEANDVKMALGSYLPVSWSADASHAVQESENSNNQSDSSDPPKKERIDPVSAAGLEMVELLILATELQKEKTVRHRSLGDDS